MKSKQLIVQSDPWQALRSVTDARIALGRTGVSIPLAESLAFKLAHANARDAVYNLLDKELLIEGIQKLNHPLLLLHAAAANRQQYLQRPDYGRRLNEASIKIMEQEKADKPYDICISIADGLSATAVNNHAIPLLFLLMPLLKNAGFSMAPVCIIEQGRVAISDQTGQLSPASLSLILLGERPGLSSPDSLGAYLTYNPLPGNTDALRNCISNIRPGGLSVELAAQKIYFLIKESLRLKLSGVPLKDESAPSLPFTQTKSTGLL
ncbi:MAG: ethanolamine ammonia-lyase subunit EutC [Ferruginibacter sp.]